MKLKHTQAKKARRASGFHKGPGSRVQSEKRFANRAMLFSCKIKPKTYGQHIVRIQRILLKKDRFGGPIVRFIRHAAE